MAGRPSIYSEQLATDILNRISSGESLRKICQSEGMPDRTTILNWLSDERLSHFYTKYARARELQAEVMDDLILDTAQECVKGNLDPHAAKVAIGAYQWRASKLQPKKYGDRTALEHSGPGGQELKVTVEHSKKPHENEK